MTPFHEKVTKKVYICHMKIAKKTSVGENLFYTFVWAAIFLVPILNAKLMSELHVNFQNVAISWGKIMPYFIVFIINNNILVPRLLSRNRYLWYIASVVAILVVIFGGIQALNFRYWQDSAVLQHKASFSDLEWYWNVVLGVLMIGTNTMVKLYYRALDTERKMDKMQRHALQAQMDYLKYQINPHFFMNTLNNIHSLIDIDTEMAKQSVIELSKMMRYVLYDSEGLGTTLEKEVQFVGNYMELMRIRYIDDVDIRFDHPSPAVCRRIVVPPLLLIVFVENAFKHGVSYNARSFIRISIETEGDRLHYRVVNSRHAKTAGRGGVGLDNVRKRLTLLFGKDFSLDIDSSSESTYEVNLIIPVKNHG